MRLKAGSLKSGARVAPRALAALLALLTGGCSHLHWPWHHPPPAPPTPVHELDIGGVAADTFPQYWQRNTLLLDLSAARGTGSITLKPAAGTAWPVRLAVRVTPGAFGVLDVRAAQRLSLPVVPAGKPVNLELDPGTYTPTTPQITVSWGPSPTP